jgi:Domain of unknown function (DUF4169)
MGEVLNLRRARKARERAEKARASEANRIAFGRTKTERRASEAQNELERARLDAHRLGDVPKKREAVLGKEDADSIERPAPAQDA